MKRNWKLAVVFMAIFIFAGATISYAFTEASNDTNYTINTPYQYPLTAGTDEWGALMNHAEKVDLCQIPEDILSLMTTEALAETVLSYPLLLDMYVWDSTTTGYKVIAATFNGLAELERRPDGLSTLKELSQQTLRTRDDPFFTRNLETIIREMSGLRKSAQNDQFESVTLFTPSGSPVLAYKDLTWADHNTTFQNAKQEQNQILNQYKSTVLLGNVSPAYNCHSYAWYKQSTNNQYWISNPKKYMEDGSYKNTTEWTTSAKVYYDNSWLAQIEGEQPYHYDHSGIALVSKNTIRSKWGYNALFEHNIADSPYYFSFTNLYLFK